MSDIDSVLERLRRAYAAIAEVEAVAVKSPGDQYVLANLGALKRDAEDLEQQWEEECRHAQKEVCRYRIIPEHARNYSLAAVSKSLLDFQELFSQIYGALKTGARKRARVSADVAAQTKFNFAFTYPGSLGVALTVDSEADLFANKFDEAVKAISEIVSIDDQHDVRDLAKTLGGAVVTKVYDWSRVNFGAGYGIDITWKRTDGTIRGGVIDAPALGKVVDLIARTSDRKIRKITVKGVLVGINIKTKRFRFVVPHGQDFTGILSEDFPATRRWSVNTNYQAEIMIEEITKYSTMETQKTYRLERLKGPNST
jgi:hypothetical protein